MITGILTIWPFNSILLLFKIPLARSTFRIPLSEIPEDAYTFTTEFSFDDSTIDNEELLRLCNFEKGLDLPYPEVRCFAQVCQIGNDIRRTVQCRSLSQSSSTSSTLSDYLKNSKFLTDFSNMNTNSMNTGSNSDKYKCNSGYMYAEYDNDENARMFGFSKMDGCEDAGNQITLSSNSNVPSIDEKCFNGEYVEDNDNQLS
uniref:ZP domain-containing protein n=1 Tax=Parastrongyloides trichosuri TaxID=131310 RepID=A0A0N4Z8W5_PARTI